MGKLTVTEKLRGFMQAYPEDIFPPPSPEERPQAAAAAYVLREVAVPVVGMAVDEVERLEGQIAQLADALFHVWESTGSCPCGARREAPDTHPHVIGCPVGFALDSFSRS